MAAGRCLMIALIATATPPSLPLPQDTPNLNEKDAMFPFVTLHRMNIRRKVKIREGTFRGCLGLGRLARVDVKEEALMGVGRVEVRV
eukprot:1387520-Amorphochlora_amoeboformis.AAC.1